ncbi:UDP-N-acetylglucosamine 2-epimerase [Ramlibacter agri]
MKKILAITGIRSDYDLMSALYRRLQADPQADLRLLVGGAHLSRTYGHSIDQIRADGLQVLLAVESLIDSDTPSSRLKSASILLQGAIDAVASWQPDAIVYAGDREEVWIGAMLGAYLEIPTVHFYGGDHTMSGYVDNPVRHAASKLSTYHLVAVEAHRQRLLRLGEPDERIRVVGNLSLDNFRAHRAIPREQLQQRLGLPAALGDYALVMFHPDPVERDIAPQVLGRMLDALAAHGLGAVVGYPNSDPANRGLVEAIEQRRDQPRFFAYRNLERDDFLSVYKNARLIIGNSSSGILEAASVPLAAVDVGVRQRGRLAGANVVFCDADRAAIDAAIARVLSPAFGAIVAQVVNPYGSGDASERAAQFLLHTDLRALRPKTEDPLVAGGRNP